MVAHRTDRPGARALAQRPTRWHTELVEGPDLHGFDALAEQFGRQIAAVAFRPALVVLVLAVTDAGVVDPDGLAAAPAEQVIDRLARVLAEQVPQGHIHGADGAGLAATIAEEVDGVEHILPVALDIEGAAPEQQVGKHVVHHRADARGT